MNLEALALLMQNNVNRVNGEFTLSVDYFDTNYLGDEAAEEWIDLEYFDSDGNGCNVSIDSITEVREDGLILCKNSQGQTVEVEIFERVRKFD